MNDSESVSSQVAPVLPLPMLGGSLSSPAADDKPVVFLINQISSHGHLDMYARLYAQAFLDLGNRVVLIAEHEAGVTSWLSRRGWNADDFEFLERGSLCQIRFSAAALADAERPSSLLAGVVQVWRREGLTGISYRLGCRAYNYGRRLFNIVGRFIKEYSIGAAGVDLRPIVDEILVAIQRRGNEPALVFFLYLDMIDQSLMSCRHLARLRVPWAGLLFHPRCLGATDAERSERYFHKGNTVGAVFLNPHAAPVYQRMFPHRTFGVLPDVTDAELPPVAPELVKRFREKAGGRTIVLALGSIAPHKGIVGLIDVIEHVDPKKFFFVIAGEIFWDSFGPAQSKLRGFCENPPENCLVQAGYINDECDLNAVISAADILYAVYSQFKDSSNTLTKASIFEKPVIVSDDYLMSEKVRTYRMGAVAKFGDIKSIEKALLAVSSRSSGDFGFADYRRDNSYEALREALAPCVEGWLKASPARKPVWYRWRGRFPHVVRPF